MDPIRVIYHHEPDGWWAESPDVPRWFAAASTCDAARHLAVEGIPLALEWAGEPAVSVSLEHFLPEAELSPSSTDGC